MRFWLLAVGVLVIAFPASTQAQRSDVLEGIESVGVLIEGLSQAASDAGLSKEALTTAVELRLR